MEIKEWLKDTAIRTVKTMAETALSMLTIGVGIQDVNWGHIASVTAVAGVYTVILALSKLKTDA